MHDEKASAGQPTVENGEHEQMLSLLQTLSALYNTAQRLSQSLDLTELAEFVVTTVVRVFGAKLAWIGRAEADGSIRVLVHCPDDVDYPRTLALRWDDTGPGRGPTGRALQSGLPVVVADLLHGEDVPAERRAGLARLDLRSAAAFPLITRNTPFGVLAVYSDRTDYFAPSRVDFFQTFTHQVAAALENARLLGEQRRRADEFAALYDTAQIMASQQDIPSLLASITERAASLLRARGGAIGLYDPIRNEVEFVVAYGFPLPQANRVPAGHGLAGRVAAARAPLIVNEYHNWESRLSGDPADTVRSAVGVPLLHRAELIGVLTLTEFGESSRTFTDDDVRLLTLFAGHAAAAVHNVQLFAAATRRLDQLQALRDIDAAISGTLDLHVALSVFLDKVTAQLRMDAATVLLLNPQTQQLQFAASRGFRTPALQHTHLRLGKGYAGRAALERQPVLISDLTRAPGDLGSSPLFPSEGFIGYLAMPLISKGQVRGVLELFRRVPLEPDQEWMDFLATMASQAALALDNAVLLEGLQRANIDLTLAYDTTLEGWSRAMDLRDRDTEGHTQRVAEVTLRLARAMGVPDADLVHLRHGALLHDIGKMGIPDGILHKPGPLSDAEWEVMRRHPLHAYELLSSIRYLRPALDIPYCHHEKWDGTGYPRGLRGQEIPLAARIFAVVDVWDALRSDRPYRQAWPDDQAREYIREQAGKHFDPAVVDAFLRLA